jgi:nitrite reductase/ring-hydroxylating ferredoxin subunit
MQRTLELHNRRIFCKRLASAAACASGAVLLQSCSGNAMGSIPGSALPTVGGTLTAAGVTVLIAAGSPLASTGGMALVTSNAGDFLVTRTGATTFVALTAQCTHQACVVSDATSTTYVCPCHGSEFDPTTGRVVVGPAVAPLRQFTSQLSGNVLTIT